MAFADPSQPGVTVPPGQPEATAPPSQPGVTVRPGVSVQPAGVRALPDEVAPPSDYGPSRPVPHYTSIAPGRPERLHPPIPMPGVAPIVPPPRIVRIGDWTMPSPGWLPDGPLRQVNGTAAGVEAGISTFARSVGIAPSRADELAAYETDTGAKLLLIGCAALGIPGAVIGSIVPVIGTVAVGALGCALGAGFVGLIGAPTIAITFAMVGAGAAQLPNGPIPHLIGGAIARR
jgi:hypothetical protein